MYISSLYFGMILLHIMTTTTENEVFDHCLLGLLTFHPPGHPQNNDVPTKAPPAERGCKPVAPSHLQVTVTRWMGVRVSGPSLMWTHHDFEEATSHLGQLNVEETKNKKTTAGQVFPSNNSDSTMMLFDVIKLHPAIEYIFYDSFLYVVWQLIPPAKRGTFRKLPVDKQTAKSAKTINHKILIKCCHVSITFGKHLPIEIWMWVLPGHPINNSPTRLGRGYDPEAEEFGED